MTNETIYSSSLPKVAVIILNWNGKDDTLECLASVKKLDYANYEIVVVDNGSNDASVDAISKQYPDVTLLQTCENLGYAGGNNVGICWALEQSVDYVLVLNNDTIVDTQLLRYLVAAGFDDNQIGLLGPTNYYYSEPNKIWTIGATINEQPHTGYKMIGDGDNEGTWRGAIQFDALIGSAILIHKRVFESIGLFDERFFLCWEELDFCERARKADYKCLFVPEAKIWHKVGSTLGGNESPLRTYFNVRNRLLWAKKNLSLSARFKLSKESYRTFFLILLPSLVLIDTNLSLAKRLLWSFSSWVRTIKRNFTNPTNRATLVGLRDYYLGRFGNCPECIRLLKEPK